MTHQNLKGIYLLLCIIGTILPYSQFVPWLLANGVDFPLFFEELFANPISTFFREAGMSLFLPSFCLYLSLARGHALGRGNGGCLWLPPYSWGCRWGYRSFSICESLSWKRGHHRRTIGSHNLVPPLWTHTRTGLV